MESQGVLSTMRECEWKQFLKDECDFPETRLHNILVRDTEETLLEVEIIKTLTMKLKRSRTGFDAH